MIKRETESLLKRLSSQYPIVTVTGPRQSGKTTLSKKVFPAKKYVNLEELDTREFAISDPRGFLKQYGDNLIIDEIQRAPDLPSYIQVIADKNKKSSFILTGSQQFEVMEGINQSLSGRTAFIKLLPFSIKEIEKIYNVENTDGLMSKGFYPRIYDKKLKSREFYSSYVSTYLERDVRRLVSIKKLSLFQKFLKLCAGRIGNILNLQNIANDTGVSHTTIREWFSILEASYIVHFLRPWHENLSKRLIKFPKLYFYDVGLAAYLLGIENENQMSRDPLRGSLFENMVVSEFLKRRFNSGKDNNLYFYRDGKGNEVDLIYRMGGEILPIEIKSGATISEDYFANLNRFKTISKKKIFKPTVIYGGDEIQNRSKVGVYPFYRINNILSKI